MSIARSIAAFITLMTVELTAGDSERQPGRRRGLRLRQTPTRLDRVAGAGPAGSIGARCRFFLPVGETSVRLVTRAQSSSEAFIFRWSN